MGFSSLSFAIIYFFMNTVPSHYQDKPQTIHLQSPQGFSEERHSEMAEQEIIGTMIERVVLTDTKRAKRLIKKLQST